MELEQLKTFFIQLWNVISTFWNSSFKAVFQCARYCVGGIHCYHAIKLIRETRAIQLLKGILLLGVAICCCQSIQNGSDDVLRKVFEFAVIGLWCCFSRNCAMR